MQRNDRIDLLLRLTASYRSELERIQHALESVTEALEYEQQGVAVPASPPAPPNSQKE